MDFSGVGYNRVVMTSLTNIFTSSAQNPQASVSAFSVDPSRGPLSILSGTPAPQLTTAHNADIGSGSNAGANIQNSDNVSAKQGQMAEVKDQFVKMAADVQGSLQAALEQGALDLGFDPQTARNSFMPPPPSSDVTDVALNAGAPGVTTVAEVLNTAPKLTAKQEQQLAAKVSALLTPSRDAEGQVVKEPAVPNKMVEQERLADVEFLKAALKPVEEQPEFKAIAAVEEKLDKAAEVHEVQNPVDEAVVAVAEKAGVNVDAIDAQAPGIELDQVRFTGDTLAGLEIKGDLRVSLAALSGANDPAIEEALKRLRKPNTENAVPPPQAALMLGGMAA